MDRDISDTSEGDGRAQTEERIADALAELSDTVEAPTGVASCASFAPEDVDFKSNGWMSRLIDVQGWLGLNDDLTVVDPAAFILSLSERIGFDPATAGVEECDNVLQLTNAALERLAERIEYGIKAQEMFVAELESDNGSKESATAVWAAEWNADEELPEAATLKPVSAHAEVWPISEFIGTDLNLAPSYQRGDVWQTGDRQALIESILRGIPLPSVILLRTGPTTPYEVVDGKQRLTAILRFVGKHPKAMERVAEANRLHPDVNFEDLFERNYPKFRLAWKRYMGESLTAKLEDEYYFPFKLRNDDKGGLVGDRLEPLRGKYFTDIREKTIYVAEEEVQIDRLFNRTVKYKVPVIEYTKADQRQIHEVFKLYNKQGMHLNAEEIRNAVFHDIELTRAILVAAGDADRHASIANVAPSIADVPHVQYLGKTLADYGFGKARYRRTKVLGWVIAVLVRDSGGKLLPTTARHIDLLLESIQQDDSHPLREPARLADLFALVSKAADLHASHDELWPEKFRGDGKSSRWQDLQVVGSLVGVAIALAAAPDDIEDRIDANAEMVRHAALTEWSRPEKAQTRTQWDYIARIAAGFVDKVGLDVSVASEVITKMFGSSGVDSLLNSRFTSENL